MTLETLSQSRAQLEAAGFVEELVADGHELRAVSSGTRYVPSDLHVARLVRFQGITGPEEEAVLFALATSDGRPLGTYAPPSRPALGADDAAIVAQLHEQAIPEAEIQSHTRPDHIAAVFATRDAASHAFECNAETELVHDTGTGVAAGAAVGVLAGMSIAAVALVPGGVIGLGGILAFGATGGRHRSSDLGTAQRPTPAPASEHPTRIRPPQALVAARVPE
jgi:hypothetical protein